MFKNLRIKEKWPRSEIFWTSHVQNEFFLWKNANLFLKNEKPLKTFMWKTSQSENFTFQIQGKNFTYEKTWHTGKLHIEKLDIQEKTLHTDFWNLILNVKFYVRNVKKITLAYCNLSKFSVRLSVVRCLSVCRQCQLWARNLAKALEYGSTRVQKHVRFGHFAESTRVRDSSNVPLAQI